MDGGNPKSFSLKKKWKIEEHVEDDGMLGFKNIWSTKFIWLEKDGIGLII